MGMYTQLQLDLELKKDTPREIINVLADMVNGESKKWGNRLDWCFNSNSYYFNAFSYAKIWEDDITSSYKLFVHCDFKNYDNEIQILLDWLKPYIDTTGMIGYMRYEEYIEPTILYN